MIDTKRLDDPQNLVYDESIPLDDIKEPVLILNVFLFLVFVFWCVVVSENSLTKVVVLSYTPRHYLSILVLSVLPFGMT